MVDPRRQAMNWTGKLGLVMFYAPLSGIGAAAGVILWHELGWLGAGLLAAVVSMSIGLRLIGRAAGKEEAAEITELAERWRQRARPD